MSPRLFRKLLIGIAVLAVLAALGRFAVFWASEEARRSNAESDAISVAHGATAFYQEYGRFPATNSGILGGNVLAALTGDNKERNPKGLEFIEAPTAQKGKGGITNGTLVDPWGAPYLFAIDNDGDGMVKGGTNAVDVRKKVAVWNDPNLGTDAAGLSEGKKKRRYVTSWE